MSLIVASASIDVQYAIDSIAYGSLFALMALSLALLFGVMGLMNFAYGELIMIGAYVMYFTRDQGWVAMIVSTVAIVVIASVLLELIAFRPFRRASPIILLITSFAVSYGLQALGWSDILGLAHISPFNTTIGTGPQKGVEPYPWLTNQFDISGVLISPLTIITVATTAVLLLAMTLLLKKTDLGIRLRASTEDFRMAQLVGVRANWVISSAFAITGFLAGVVALLYVLRTGAVAPDIGQGPLLIAFVGGVIGGLGSLVGAALGGFTLGVLINLLQSTLPREDPPLNNHTQLFAFLFVIVILVVLPDGLVSLPRRIREWRRGRARPAVAEKAST
jgi:branched-chain amino acid transport system permease protein